jgi:hypothetical protein
VSPHANQEIRVSNRSASGNELSGTTLVVRDDGELLTTVIDGELIGMSVEQGACYGLNAVGTRVWELLAEPRSLEDLCEQLREEYEVDGDQCQREVRDLVEQLRREGLVKVSTA